MRIYDKNLFLNADISVNQTSDPCFLESMAGYSIQVLFANGNAVGTITVQGSNDPTPIAALITNWSSIVSETLNAPGSFFFNTAECYYKWLRLQYVSSSGASTITANLHAKGI
jgi:hypothetical protein